jgi:GT2 family glycosyltransferase
MKERGTTTMDQLQMSVCIPTKDRPFDLERCVGSLLSQTRVPAEIVIIDDGNADAEHFRRLISPRTKYVYFKKDMPSLSASKNIAKKLVSHELVLIIDDDTVLETDYVEQLLRVYERDKDRSVGAVGGIIVNDMGKSRFDLLLRRLFLLDDGRPGRILPWGFQTGYHNVSAETDVQWLGNACFRKELLDRYSYEEFEGGRNALEDVEFGIRASSTARFIITPNARMYHYHSPAGREAMRRIGYKAAYNYCWIFRKHCRKTVLNSLCFGWAMTGFFLGMLGKGRSRMAFGILSGVWSFVTTRHSARL